jgi:hypothetical protein
MNLQENIHRIKEVMGVLNENWETSFKRRIHNIDGLIPLMVSNIKKSYNICEISETIFLEDVTYNTIDHMYWSYFSDVDDDTDVWTQMFDMMRDYIEDKFGEELRNDYRSRCNK